MERLTQQRRILRDVFNRAGRPLAPLEALALAREVQADLGLATVYRAIHALLEAGELRSVIVAGATRFERNHLEPHAHFHCRECDRLYDVPINQKRHKLAIPSGFRLETQEIVLYGVCSSCSSEESVKRVQV